MPPAEPAAFPDGFHPFWFWNDRITPEGIRSQIGTMADQGIRGFFIHSRQGLAQPYLSEAFLDLVALAVAEGHARGLAVHLYDEYPYPSGAAGGATVQSDPGLAGTRLEVGRLELEGGPLRLPLPAGKVLACTAFPRSGSGVDWGRPQDLLPAVGMVLTSGSYHEAGLRVYNDRRYFADTPLPVLETTLPGPQLLVTVSQVLVTDHKYWGAFPDVTSPAAVERFLQLTHERYRARLGEGLSGVASVFVDEVAPTTSKSVLAELERRHGGSLGAFLVAFAAPGHPGHLDALREMAEVRLGLFEASFEAPVAAWCARQGVRYSGEKPSLRLSQLAWMDVPGCEPGHFKAGAPRSDLLRPAIRANARATASAAYLYGKEGSLCECYHSLGWGATLQDARVIAESLLVLGTRWLVPHAFFYSTRGLRKHDAPPSFLQMPHWPLFGELSGRVGRIAEAFAGTFIDAAVGVLEPSGGLPDEAQLACYEELQHRLVAAHCDFLTVDTDILSSGHLHEGGVQLRDVHLRAVLVPPMRAPEAALEEWLERFAAAGGLVARVPDEPAIEGVVARVLAHCPPPLRIETTSGDPAGLVGACRRDPRGGRRWLLLNTTPGPVQLAVAPPEGPPLRAVPLDRAPLPALEDRGGQLGLRLEAFESVLLEQLPGAPATAPAGTRGAALRLELAGPFALRPLAPNVLRLGRWRLSLPEEGPGAALVEPAPLANQLRRSRLPFAPSITDTFGSSPTLGLPPLLARYETAFACATDAPLRLVMEPGALAGAWRLWVDGAGPFGPEDLSPGPGHVEGCVSLELHLEDGHGGGGGGVDAGRPHGPSRRAPVRHEVVVEVRVGTTEDGLSDCLYLAGDFGVVAPPDPGPGPVPGKSPAAGAGGPYGRSDGQVPEVPLLATLVPPFAEGELGAWEANGLPYYAGVLEHSSSLPLPPFSGPEEGTARSGGAGGRDGEEVLVELGFPASCEDAAEVAFGDGPWRPLPWSPRRLLVPAQELAPGQGGTRIRIRLLTTLVRAFEGRYFAPSAHAYREVELLTFHQQGF